MYIYNYAGFVSSTGPMLKATGAPTRRSDLGSTTVDDTNPALFPIYHILTSILSRHIYIYIDRYRYHDQ